MKDLVMGKKIKPAAVRRRRLQVRIETCQYLIRTHILSLRGKNGKWIYLLLRKPEAETVPEMRQQA